MSTSLPQKHALGQSSPPKAAKHPRLTASTEPNTTPTSSEIPDGDQIPPDVDPTGEFPRLDARTAELSAASTAMRDAKTAYLTATKDLNSELRKAEDDDLLRSAPMTSYLSGAEIKARKRIAEEKAMACKLLECDRILNRNGRDNLCAMFDEDDMQILNPDMYWSYINMMTDAKEKMRVVWVRRKLEEFVEMGGELCRGTVASSFVQETAGTVEPSLDLHAVTKAIDGNGPNRFGPSR